jgi:hypothetical protein
MEYSALDILKNSGLTPNQVVHHQPRASRRTQSVSEDHIIRAIVSVIETARAKGQSLDDVIAELMADDALLEPQLRYLLTDIVAQAWAQL